MTVPNEPGVLDALHLLSRYADELVVGTARETHEAISDRVHGVTRRATRGNSALPEVVHKGIATTVYSGISLGLRGAGAALGVAAAQGFGPRLEQTGRGRFVRAAVNGLVGERIRDEQHPMSFEMSVRVGGRSVPLDPERLAEAYPEAASRIVVFLHGLCENEEYWNYRRDEVGTTYPEAMVAAGWTPVMLRFNSGLTLRENGVALSALLRDLTAAWPVPVGRIALVGHSMGGLVVRAACATVVADTPSWRHRVSDVVCLGSPHLGAPIARAVNAGITHLARVPEVAPYGRILGHRSVGIENLALGLAHDVPPLPHAKYRLVSATLKTRHHPVGYVVGDLLVRAPSATGSVRGGPALFPSADIVHLPNTDHFKLLNHPDLHVKFKEWLA